MIEKIKKISSDLESDAKLLTAENSAGLRLKYLGRREGLVTALFAEFKNLDLEQKREIGPLLNKLKEDAERLLNAFSAGQTQTAAKIDYTVPPIPLRSAGHLHPMTLLAREIEQVFFGLGFDIESAPEIESDFYNFEALNIPEYHPARDMQDTFYLEIDHPQGAQGKNILLRTHISNLQVRYMQKHRPPFAAVVSGRAFRNEALDASHEHTYQELEGFAVGENITFSNMAWTLDHAIKGILGKDVKTKLVPAYFPFVEPGAELAVSCLICKGSGCSVCKQTGWVEILGCGMIHQKVFESAGYKKGQYQGFAFGVGTSRLALMKYGIPDVRMFAENDLRFLKQF